MPYGYFVSLLIAALLIGVALRPPRRPRRLGIAAYMVGLPAQEWPVLFGVLVTLSTVQAIVADGLLATPVGWVALSVAVLLLAGMAVLIARAGMGRRAVADALGIDLPAHRWARVLWPVPLRPRSIVRTPNLAYGHDHPRQRLDVYRRRDAVGPRADPAVPARRGLLLREQARGVPLAVVPAGGPRLDGRQRRLRAPAEGHLPRAPDRRGAGAGVVPPPRPRPRRRPGPDRDGRQLGRRAPGGAHSTSWPPTGSRPWRPPSSGSSWPSWSPSAPVDRAAGPRG